MSSSRVKCACGKVELSFREPHPRCRILCCCHDCRQKCLWAAGQGGPKLHSHVVSFDRPMDLVYYCNAFTVQGQEHLSFFRLRADSKSTNCLATCCNSIVMVDHPAYDGKAVLLFPEVLQLQLASPPSFVLYSEDWALHTEKLDLLRTSSPHLCRGQTDLTPFRTARNALSPLGTSALPTSKNSFLRSLDVAI